MVVALWKVHAVVIALSSRVLLLLVTTSSNFLSRMLKWPMQSFEREMFIALLGREEKRNMSRLYVFLRSEMRTMSVGTAFLCQPLDQQRLCRYMTQFGFLSQLSTLPKEASLVVCSLAGRLFTESPQWLTLSNPPRMVGICIHVRCVGCEVVQIMEQKRDFWQSVCISIDILFLPLTFHS